MNRLSPSFIAVALASVFTTGCVGTAMPLISPNDFDARGADRASRRHPVGPNAFSPRSYDGYAVPSYGGRSPERAMERDCTRAGSQLAREALSGIGGPAAGMLRQFTRALTQDTCERAIPGGREPGDASRFEAPRNNPRGYDFPGARDYYERPRNAPQLYR